MYSIPTLLLLGLVVFALGKGAFGVLGKERESARTVQELEEATLAAEERKDELESAIAKLKTEEGITEEIKRKFNMVREGEHVAVIVDERTAAAAKVPETQAWYQRVWAAIMSLYE